jgi:enoyl-CoA hydratase
MQSQSYQRIKLDRQGPILTVTLSNPKSRNSVDGMMHQELPHALRDAARDMTIGAIVLTGDPQGGAFCAGGDLPWTETLRGSGDDYARVLREGAEIVHAMVDAPQPIISMINGAAVGLGATLALLADVSFADETAVIADKHVSIGVSAGDGGSVIWPLLIGPNRAKEYLMTGDPISGARAAEIGLINHAVPADQLRERAYAFAERMANGPRLAIEMTKRSINLYVNMVVNQVLDGSLALEGLTFRTHNHVEAVRAFLAKEQPVFKNP